jgi:DNA-binding PadR family transcriptional regulator
MMMNTNHAGRDHRRHHEPFGPEQGFGPAFGPGFHPGPGHHGGPGRMGEAGGRGRRRGMRAPRGDVRAAVLQLLGEEPMHGYQLMQRIAERSEGAWRPSPGAIYPVLAQLEDEGLVEVARDQGRNLATLTDAGRAYIAANTDELGDPFAALREESGSRVDLRGPLEELISAARQLGRSGSTAQQESARSVLREARRSLYLILADGDPDAASEEPRASSGE